jgi:hypothetical protein
MWGLLGQAFAESGQPGVRQDPWRHVCVTCEVAWRDTVSGDSVCEFCGFPCPVSNDGLTKACTAPAGYWKLPEPDDE